jgi:hypothetical protein
MCHVFVCDGEGSSPPKMMYSIIRLLFYILNAPATSDHIVAHGNEIRVVWKKKTNKTQLTKNLKHLLLVDGDIREQDESLLEDGKETFNAVVAGGRFDVEMGDIVNVGPPL